jgi:hypothetical protein
VKPKISHQKNTSMKLAYYRGLVRMSASPQSRPWPRAQPQRPAPAHGQTRHRRVGVEIGVVSGAIPAHDRPCRPSLADRSGSTVSPPPGQWARNPLALGPIVPNEMNFRPNVVDRVVFTDGGVIFERKAPALIFAAART